MHRNIDINNMTIREKNTSWSNIAPRSLRADEMEAIQLKIKRALHMLQRAPGPRYPE